MRVRTQFYFKTIAICIITFTTFYLYQNDKYRSQRIETIQSVMVKTLPSSSRFSAIETIIGAGTIFFLISDYSIEKIQSFLEFYKLKIYKTCL